MEEIIWKDINDFENYKINNLGQVVNKISGREKTIFKRKGTDKLMVGLDKNGHTYSKSIDKLLYEHFGIDYNNESKIEDEIWKDILKYEGSIKPVIKEE